MLRYDSLYKLLVVGDSGVGKTSLIRRFVSDKFSSEFLTTIVIDFQMKVVQLEGKKAKLQIWSVAPHAMTPSIVLKWLVVTLILGTRQ